MQGLPIPAQCVSVHAWGLRPRRVLIRLAIAAHEMLPSVVLKHVGTRNFVFISGLNTQPIRTPVNASVPPLPMTPHDSGTTWMANPSPQGFCIPTTLPILSAHLRIEDRSASPVGNDKFKSGFNGCLYGFPRHELTIGSQQNILDTTGQMVINIGNK